MHPYDSLHEHYDYMHPYNSLNEKYVYKTPTEVHLQLDLAFSDDGAFAWLRNVN